MEPFGVDTLVGNTVADKHLLLVNSLASSSGVLYYQQVEVVRNKELRLPTLERLASAHEWKLVLQSTVGMSVAK